MTWHQIVYLVLLGTAFAYSLARGGKPERYVATAILIASFASAAVIPWTPRVRGVLTGVLAVDLVLMGVLVAVALRADRRWPLTVAAMHAVAVMGHLVQLTKAGLNGTVYGFLIIAWSFPMLMVVIVATWRHQRRERAVGPEPDWSKPPVETPATHTGDRRLRPSAQD